MAATLAVVLVGKPLAALFIVWFSECPVRTGLAVAVALAQIGEFSFILATVARDLGLLPDPAHNALVAASILSISLNPLLYRLIDGFEMKLKGWPALWRVLNARANGMPRDMPTERSLCMLTHQARLWLAMARWDARLRGC